MACEYCKNERYLVDRPGFTPGIEVEIDGSHLCVSSYYEGGYWGDDLKININFCPMCGAKLGEQIKVGDHIECQKYEYKRALVERIDFDERGFQLLSVQEGQKYGVVYASDCKIVE